MKKTNFLKWIYFAILLLIVSQSCRQENLLIESENNSAMSKPVISVLDYSEIETDKALVKELGDLQKKFNRNSNFSARTIQDSLLDGAVIEINKVLLIEDGDKKTYTFPISRIFPNNKIENLVLKKNADNSFSGLLAQYTITDEQKQLFMNGHSINLGSNARFYRIDNINISARVQTDVVGCFRITWETGYCASGQHNASNAGDCKLKSGVPEPKILAIEDECQIESGGGSFGSGSSGGMSGGAAVGSGGGGGGPVAPSSPYNTYIFMSYDDVLLFCPQDDAYCAENWANQVATVNFFSSLGRNSVLSEYNNIFFAVKDYLVDNGFSSDSKDFLAERLNLIGNWFRTQSNTDPDLRLHNFKVAYWILNLMFEDDMQDVQNFFNRVNALDNALAQNPNLLLNIPCGELPKWQDVATHQVPQSVKAKLQNIKNQTSWWSNWQITDLDDGASTRINMDVFPVHINTLPNKPNSNQKYTPDEFFNFFRLNLNLFAEKFTPIVDNYYGINDTALWNSSNPLGALIHIEIPIDNGTVVCSGLGPKAWVFSTIKAPLSMGYDGIHPVSGNRLFGYYVDPNDNTMYIYTRGVDRVSQVATSFPNLANYLIEVSAFTGADNL